MPKRRICLCGIVLFSLSVIPVCAGEGNLALGKSYTLAPTSNYTLSKDEGDMTQLTDGFHYEGPSLLWTQKTTVGWKRNYVAITIDLGKVEPIGGAAFYSGFTGLQNVPWPRFITVFTSENGQEYYRAGELVNPSWSEDGLPPEYAPWKPEQHKGKALFYKYTTKLAAKGRYVCFVVKSSRFIFCDEIEVYRGSDSLLNQPLKGKKVDDINAYFQDSLFSDHVAAALFNDINNIRKNLTGLSPDNRKDMEKRISVLVGEVENSQFPCPEADYRAITPLNSLHECILRLNAEVLRSRKFPPLFAWHNNRYDPLQATEVPAEPPVQTPALNVEMMNNEYRADVVNVTNTTPASLEVQISFSGLPGGDTPDYLTVYQVEFVGTSYYNMMADPLVEAGKTKQGFSVKIPSGMTRQVWLSFHPLTLEAKQYQGTVSIRETSRSLEINMPLTFKVAPFTFPDKPRISLGLWDYTHKPYIFRSITDGNVNLAIEDMKKHFVDPYWGMLPTACLPKKEDFDREGNLVQPLRTEIFDDWIKKLPTDRHYFIFIGWQNLRDFHGEPAGSPRFMRMVSQWSKSLAEHVKDIGLNPSRIGLEFMDEPHNDSLYQVNSFWASAVREGAPEFILFTDAQGYGRNFKELKKTLSLHDIICPSIELYGGITQTIRDTVEPDKKLWLYGCSSPSQLDPYFYNRLMAWRCWLDGAVGMGFWNYWNSYQSAKQTAWNQFTTIEESFGMVYSTADSITGSKHWEAVREGMEDYEYLSRLNDRVKELKKDGVRNDVLQKAEAWLKTVPQQIYGRFSHITLLWSTEKDRNPADTARMEILKMLTELDGTE